MSHQLQQPTGQQSQFQQPQQLSQQSQLVGRGFAQSVSPQVTQAVLALDRLETLAEHADKQAIRQGNVQVHQIADAIKDVAHLRKELIVEENPLAEQVGQCSQQVIQSATQQLQQFQQQPEIQELVSEAQQILRDRPADGSALPSIHSQGSQQWGRRRSTF